MLLRTYVSTFRDFMLNTGNAGFVLILAAILGGSVASGAPPAHRNLLQVDGKPTYIHGANLPWLDGAWSHDIGISQRNPKYRCTYNSKHVDTYFRDMKKMNLNTIRVWVYEGLEGLTFDSNGLVSGLQNNFLANLDNMVSIAKRLDMHLYFCLAADFRDSCRMAGVKDIYSDPIASRSYIDNAVKPIAERYKGNSVIFAFDIINEPGFEVRKREVQRGAWEEMRLFILANVNAIHQTDRQRLVTIGGGINKIVDGTLSGLNLDFYDLHYYGKSTLPHVSSFNLNKPVIIGEYGHRPNKTDFDLQNRFAKEVLKSALQKGYSGTLIWAYENPNGKKLRAYSLPEGGGSEKWRPVCYTLKNFSWQELSMSSKSNPTGRSAQSGTPSPHVAAKRSDLTSLRKIANSEKLNAKGEVVALDLTGISLLEPHLPAIGTLPSLESLTLHKTNLTDGGLKTIGRLLNLKYLSMGRTQITSDGLRHLKGLKKIKGLRINGNKGIGDSGVGHLTEMKKLTVLQINNTSISEAGIQKLKRALPNCKIIH
tara:strand:+ start:1265 stop:2878 length:1614 start_codon:yes stop_codon:yes gene_type:complete